MRSSFHSSVCIEASVILRELLTASIPKHAKIYRLNGNLSRKNRKFFKGPFDQKTFSMYSRKMNEIEITVFAKINIGLEVFWRRPTGYHDIESIFQNVNLADILCISIDKRSSIAVEGEVGCPPDKSSIYHAAKVFDQACGGIVEKRAFRFM